MAKKNNKISNKKLPQGRTKDYTFRDLLNFRFQNQLTLRQISDLTGIPHQTLFHWYKPIHAFIKNPDKLDIYKNNKAQFLSAVEYELLANLLDKKKIKDASLNNLAYAFQQLFNARRLEEGLSTGNLAVNVERKLQEAHEKASEMRDKIRSTS